MQKNKFCPRNTAFEHLRAYFNGNGLENPKIVIFKVIVTHLGSSGVDSEIDDSYLIRGNS